jgi:arsenate reductase (thioredoxin)
VRILFLCTGNSCRSQFAEHITQQLATSLSVEVESAGTNPGEVHPLAVRVLAEIGINASSAASKALDPGRLGDFDLVITLCGDARDSCPVLPPGVQGRHWPLDDPARAAGSCEERLAVFRRVRDEVRERVAALLEELAV